MGMKVGVCGQDIFIAGAVATLPNTGTPFHPENEIRVPTIPSQDAGIMKFVPAVLTPDFEIGIYPFDRDVGIPVPLGPF